MATTSEVARGARRRTMIPRVRAGEARGVESSCPRRGESGRDSGLSSDNTTPTGSPPPRSQKIVVPPLSVVNSLVAARKGDNASRVSAARTSRILRSRPGADSPRSQDSMRTRQIASPFRPVFTGNGQSPSLSLDSGDEESPRLERCNYHQDIVSIKTGLLKLMRVVQEVIYHISPSSPRLITH
uniref:BUD2 protein n=1 Tax=Fopius arisanus TaxID=64838 RepID=A0A0C9QJD5_9HYME